MKNALTIILIIFLVIAAIGACAALFVPDNPTRDGQDSSIDSNLSVDSNNGNTDDTIDSENRETDNTVDSENDKKDETVDLGNTLPPEEPEEPNEPEEPVDDISTYVKSSDCDDTVVIIEGVEYRALTLEAMGFIANAYYFSEKAYATIYEGGDANTAAKFYATKTFTKDTLPMSSVIWVNSGWQYRPEGWAYTGTRPENTMCPYVIVNETWWDTYDIRGFNIMKSNSSSLVGTSAETVYENFKIYIPVDKIAESEVA